MSEVQLSLGGAHIYLKGTQDTHLGSELYFTVICSSDSALAKVSYLSKFSFLAIRQEQTHETVTSSLYNTDYST